ncbi:Putative zinc- or iron-chelating domain protein [uncultured archaeon]|nr:Putative zinc- or iron-chelating domain protein [uncultured archaeon]
MTGVIVAAFFAGIPAYYMYIRGVMLARNKKKWKCHVCGNCCRLREIEVTVEDKKKLDAAGFPDAYIGDKMRRVNGKCVFLKDDKCSIHKESYRPEICGEFPFFCMYGMEYMKVVSFCPATEEFLKDKK